MTHDVDAARIPPEERLGMVEFIALMATLFAVIAFSTDSMLPALPRIAAELTPADPNRAQLIVTVFLAGLGLGMLVAGPLSDALGRRPVVVGGAALFVAGALLAWRAPTLETLLAARLVMGLGAAGPRTVVLALVRDLYAGRDMARIMAFVITVFALVPAAAPLIGQGVIAVAGWRALFPVFIAFIGIGTAWLMLRQAETLPPDRRIPFRLARLRRAASEVVGNPVVRATVAVQIMAYAALFGTITSTQPIFDVAYGRADTFALWFAGIALASASGSLLNSRIVVRLGMRRVAAASFRVQVVFAGALALLGLIGVWPDGAPFWLHVVWTTTVFAMAGLTIGNLNALAMEPMGHVAGMASSLIGAVSTVGGALLATPIGLAFDGTPVPLTLGVALASVVAILLLSRVPD